jgi:hypothetical protein
MNAGVSGLASQAAVSMINNDGDLSAVLKELGSGQERVWPGLWQTS